MTTNANAAALTVPTTTRDVLRLMVDAADDGFADLWLARCADEAEFRATVRRDGREYEARAHSSTEAIAAADDAAAAWVRTNYPEFAADGLIPAGAYAPTEEDSRP